MFEEYIYSLHEERFLPRTKPTPTTNASSPALAEGNGKAGGNGNNNNSTTVTISTAAATITIPDLGGNKTRASVMVGGGANSSLGNAMQAAAMNVLGTSIYYTIYHTPSCYRHIFNHRSRSYHHRHNQARTQQLQHLRSGPHHRPFW
ncbi:hypothetical protein EON63_09845 [archaeon]|nr:MAG: hypothetical protein EON63_09845 [archaeon]